MFHAASFQNENFKKNYIRILQKREFLSWEYCFFSGTFSAFSGSGEDYQLTDRNDKIEIRSTKSETNSKCKCPKFKTPVSGHRK